MKSSWTVSPAVAISQVSGHHGGAYSDQTSASGRAGTCACWHTIELFAKRSGNGRLPTTAAKARRKSTRLRRPGGSRRLPEDGALSKRCRSDEGVLCDLDERGDHRHSKPRRQAQGLVRHGERDSGGPHQATRLGGRRVGMVVVRRRQAAQGYVDGVPFRLHERHVAATATGRIYVNGYPVLRH